MSSELPMFSLLFDTGFMLRSPKGGVGKDCHQLGKLEMSDTTCNKPVNSISQP